MGYTIGIGELIETREDGISFYEAKEIKLPNAPSDGVPTDQTNQRWPGYSAWSEFLKAANLPYEKFIGAHPGRLRITTDHKRMVDRAYSLKDSLPNYHLVRLEWLKFWVDYSLEHIKNPYIVNS